MKYLLIGFLTCCFPISTHAQELKPGFDPDEYLEVLALNFGKYDSIMKAQGKPVRYQRTYASAVTGLDNRFWVWQRTDAPVAVIGLRGTVATRKSWIANIYSVQHPATGKLQLNDSTSVAYQLAAAEGAAVHTGWLIGLASMAASVEARIRDLHAKGTRQLVISGHSQGGALAYLLRSWLHYRMATGALPADLVFKTYCSAAPKPGNMAYAYDFDFITRGGWAFNVVNAADWVPETPVSLQQLSDLNPLNPLVRLEDALRGQKWPVRLYAGMGYGKLTRKSRKAVRKYQKYLGVKVGREAAKSLPGLAPGPGAPGFNYMRAGNPVVLMPDTTYFNRFPNDPKEGLGVWTHHSFEAYHYLLRKDYLLRR